MLAGPCCAARKTKKLSLEAMVKMCTELKKGSAEPKIEDNKTYIQHNTFNNTN